ncbi:MAG: beta-lysylation protein EpmB [Pseudomonadota bacterium]|jgi:EF-P beta-lysylation protein EpmB
MPGSVITLSQHAAEGCARGAKKWQEILADLVTEPKELLQILGLQDLLPTLDPALSGFAMKVPRPFIARMEAGNPADPLLRQVLPLHLECQSDAGAADPLDEAAYNPVAGLLHKYHGRVLLTVAPHCAIHCRYCFRRDFPYADNTPGRAQWQAAFDYIAADTSITEVIFSGGDPLAASDRHLAWLTQQLDAIPHLQRLRIHTRTPVVIPQRVTDELLDWLGATRLQPVMVLHSNHANEIDTEVAAALARLTRRGIPLLNQAVLLRGVNDAVDSLIALSESLFRCGVLPYYLHLLDPVRGVSHFDVPEGEARTLVAGMRARLPGYLVPRLVREIAGRDAKTVLG